MLKGWNNETVLHENRSYFPGERKCIVFAFQHGGNDVTWIIVSLSPTYFCPLSVFHVPEIWRSFGSDQRTLPERSKREDLQTKRPSEYFPFAADVFLEMVLFCWKRGRRYEREIRRLDTYTTDGKDILEDIKTFNFNFGNSCSWYCIDYESMRCTKS